MIIVNDFEETHISVMVRQIKLPWVVEGVDFIYMFSLHFFYVYRWSIMTDDDLLFDLLSTQVIWLKNSNISVVFIDYIENQRVPILPTPILEYENNYWKVP